LRSLALVVLGLATLGACARESAAVKPAAGKPTSPSTIAVAVEGLDAAVIDAGVDAAPAQLDADGDDDPSDTGSGEIPAEAHFEKVGRAPLSLKRICDLTPFGDALYAAHANDPLGTDGATITRYVVGAERPFTVAFDWNRPGEPTKGGGAGQGFVRVHASGGRLFVPDADPPYGGFGISEHGTEGFVYVSDPEGKFARARGEHLQPPLAPTADGGAGAAVLPRAYHVLDAIRFRGRYYATTGSVPPSERAWRGASPGALHVANASLSRWTYETDYPFPWQNGVWRLTFAVRFKDRLFAGIQDYDGREPNDYVVFAPPAASTSIGHEDTSARKVTPRGGAGTVRWYADRGSLYWITIDRGGVGALRVTKDGETWTDIALPPYAGRPSDITRFRDALVVLTEKRLFKLENDGATLTAIAVLDAPKKPSPFVVDDLFCAAPLGVYKNELYAGGQRDGALYRLAAGAQ
jgi:hypothetical protein